MPVARPVISPSRRGASLHPDKGGGGGHGSTRRGPVGVPLPDGVCSSGPWHLCSLRSAGAYWTGFGVRSAPFLGGALVLECPSPTPTPPSQAGHCPHPPRAPPGVRGAACEGQTHHCHTKCTPHPPPRRTPPPSHALLLPSTSAGDPTVQVPPGLPPSMSAGDLTVLSPASLPPSTSAGDPTVLSLPHLPPGTSAGDPTSLLPASFFPPLLCPPQSPTLAREALPSQTPCSHHFTPCTE